MPSWITISGANEWEAATSIGKHIIATIIIIIIFLMLLAAAFIRQNIELFDRLSDYHDKAMSCLPNTGILLPLFTRYYYFY